MYVSVWYMCVSVYASVCMHVGYVCVCVVCVCGMFVHVFVKCMYMYIDMHVYMLYIVYGVFV